MLRVLPAYTPTEYQIDFLRCVRASFRATMVLAFTCLQGSNSTDGHAFDKHSPFNYVTKAQQTKVGSTAYC